MTQARQFILFFSGLASFALFGYFFSKLEDSLSVTAKIAGAEPSLAITIPMVAFFILGISSWFLAFGKDWKK